MRITSNVRAVADSTKSNLPTRAFVILAIAAVAGWVLWSAVNDDGSESLSAEGSESSIDDGPLPAAGALDIDQTQRALLTIEAFGSDESLEVNVGDGATHEGADDPETTEDSVSAQGEGATADAGPTEGGSSTTASGPAVLDVRPGAKTSTTISIRGTTSTTDQRPAATSRTTRTTNRSTTITTNRRGTTTRVTPTTRPGSTTRVTTSTTRRTTTTQRTTTTRRPTTTRQTTTTERTTTSAHPTPSGNLANPNNYRVIPNFNANNNLPSQKARDAYHSWWAGYNKPNSNWQDSPHELFAPVNPGTSLGSYHYARSGGFYLSSIVDFIRTTGDPAALTELVKWSTKLRSNLKDHDGRGYAYFQYYNPSGENSFAYYDDTNFLDEQMLAGGIANIAWAMHDNRNYSSAAAREADFWFKYLDQNWVPKWLARSTVRQSSPYVPPASLGLQNAVGWTSPDNPRHDDTQSAYDPANPQWSGGGIVHKFPVREFGHPYLMSTYQYLVMGKYFQQTGKSVMGTPNRTANDYVSEANTRHDFWYAKTTPQSDGSREWWLNLSKSRNGLRADAYSQSVNIYLNALHWQGFRNFGRDADMRAYAKVWYAGPNAGSSDVYNPGDTRQMRHFADGSGGNDQFVMMFSSLLGCWDGTGEMMRLNDQAILSDTSHQIGGGKGFQHGSHYNGILSCELKQRS